MSHTDSASPINTIIIKIIVHTYLVGARLFYLQKNLNNLLEKIEQHNTYSFFLPENLDGKGMRIVFSAPHAKHASPSRLLLHKREVTRGRLGAKEGCCGFREQ